MADEYTWKNEQYPAFYPAPDAINDGRYIIELAIICYPYKKGDGFDSNAFPEELRGRGESGNTKFYIWAHDENTGKCIENLTWSEACAKSNELNKKYHKLIRECADNFTWDKLPYKIKMGDIIYNK